MDRSFPNSFRPSKIAERRTFYAEEFDSDCCNAYLNGLLNKSVSFSFDLGVETGMVHRNATQPLFIRLGAISREDMIGNILHYLPEDIYYDRNIYVNPGKCAGCGMRKKGSCFLCDNFIGQELVFDIDPENYYCPHCDGSSNQRLYSFCEDCCDAARLGTIRLYETLSDRFERLRVFFTGRGYHIHVADEAAYLCSTSERMEYTNEANRIGVPIDAHVTTGEMYLIRLPYSLNGLVGRIVIELSYEQLQNARTVYEKSKPKYLG